MSIRIEVRDNAGDFLAALAAVAPEGEWATKSALRAAAGKARTRARREIAEVKRLRRKDVAKRVNAWGRVKRHGFGWDAYWRLWGGHQYRVRREGRGAKRNALPEGARSRPFRVKFDNGHEAMAVRGGPHARRRKRAPRRFKRIINGRSVWTELPIDVVEDVPLVALDPELGDIIQEQARYAMRVDYPAALKRELARRGRRAAKRGTRRTAKQIENSVIRATRAPLRG